MVCQETAVERHDRMVHDEREQAERVRSDGGEQPDMWKPHARRFGGVEGEHPATSVLLELAAPEWTVIDVGAGGGRITVGVARHVRHMVAVEPSASMREVLEQTAAAAGIENLEIRSAAWEDADVAPAQFVYAANVTYGIQRIEPFLRKMDVVATDRCGLVTFVDPPQQRIAPFWRYVHGEERLRLPCRDELLNVLCELGAQPQLVSLPAHEPQSFGTRDDASIELRRRLFLGGGTEKDALVDNAIEDLTVERDGELWLRDERPNERAVIWWDAGSMERSQ